MFIKTKFVYPLAKIRGIYKDFSKSAALGLWRAMIGSIHPFEIACPIICARVIVATSFEP